MGEETVLVTGGSGYAGSWVIVELLRRGYQVRTTVRDLARADGVRAAVATAVDPAQRLSFVAANLLRDDGWAAAAEGSDYVLHVASPMPIGEYRGQDVITPAREGTRRVLEAAYHAGVKRVVMTSSTTTVMPTDPQAVADETVWSDLPDKPAYIYPRSKTLAERDAWALADRWNGAMELATVLPGQIQGPVLSSDFSASVGLIRMLLTGKMPLLPRIGWGIVDVRDLAVLHIQAMTAPDAAGERFIAAGEFLWLSDVARILREHLGDRASKVPNPKRTLPNAVVRLGALVNAEMAQLAPSLGVRTNLTAAKAQRMLGWRPRAAAESIIDAATSLIERDLA